MNPFLTVPGRVTEARVREMIARVGELEARIRPWDAGRVREAFRSRAGRRLGWEELPECFALIREGCRRSVGLRPFDVQIHAGLVLSLGQIAEMATGEGKTLTAALPACLFALDGKGVHVATVNAYLAERDEERMAPIFRFFGFRSALLPERAPPDRKKRAYDADITYGTGYEFGFDFLRDRLRELGQGRPPPGEAWLRNLRGRGAEGSGAMQRPFAYAVVDEIDSVLIDEATTPLILSGPVPPGDNPEAPVYEAADALAGRLRADEDYELEEARRRLKLTEAGRERVYALQGALRFPRMRRAWHEYVEQALIAHHLYERDVQYLVRDDKVEIIDEYTGRAFADRKWRGGLHQAVEAKEGVPVTLETRTEVTVSRQRFFQLYPCLCGMTGTALEERREFRRVYGLEVFPVPRNRPLRRVDLPPRVFGTYAAAVGACVAEVSRLRAEGRPVLVGTVSVRKSERLAEALAAADIPSVLLNARQDAEEAEIIEQAGRAGRVTIATNMAGRGADIPLGPGVAERGGLHVLALEKNGSRRIDRQLAGRAGRQGDPGSSQFFLSLEDELVRHEGAKVRGEGELPAGRWVKRFDRAQRRVEAAGRKMRKAVAEEDKGMDRIKENL